MTSGHLGARQPVVRNGRGDPVEGRDLPELALKRAVARIGGESRPGQQRMTSAVARALGEHRHLFVQAGTGTGKSLGYLIPALLHADASGTPVVVATATLALQHQLITKDVPAASDAVEEILGHRPVSAILKGRSNYACLQRIRAGVGQEQEVLPPGESNSLPETGNAEVDGVSTSQDVGAQVVALRQWAEEQARIGGVGDRDDAPAHHPGAWAQVSVPMRECLGSACTFQNECLSERSRARAWQADLIITNHALLAIDALHGGTVLPEHDAVIIDEAHELVNRVTAAASVELSPRQIEHLARRAEPWLDEDLAQEMTSAAEELRQALEASESGRVTDPETRVVRSCAMVREVTRRVVSALGHDSAQPERSQAAAAVRELFEIADRMADLSDQDVIWINEAERRGRQLTAAPLSVSGLMRERILGEATVVLTSATLTVGGSFDAIATAVGLRRADKYASSPLDADSLSAAVTLATPNPTEPLRSKAAGQPGQVARSTEVAALRGDGTGQDAVEDADNPGGKRHQTQKEPGEYRSVAGVAVGEEPADQDASQVRWEALDAGSPFDYRHQGILYVATGLPRPGRDGIAPAALEQLITLVSAAGGRTLGLFAAQRSAELAAQYVRRALPSLPVLCQGEAQLSDLTTHFATDPATCLFGTLSLWQGIDLPGETCQLVVMDKIPFPRPDDPLMQARQQAVSRAGGNGFMQVAASHAGLLLAQGAGRLIRCATDRGVVAVLDPRLMSARYGKFLRASLPPFWTTTELDVAVAALRRLRGPAASAVQ